MEHFFVKWSKIRDIENLYKGLASSVKPRDKTYEELFELMKHHQNRKLSISTESFRFNKRDRK